MDSIAGRLFNDKELDIRFEFDELFSGKDFSEKKGGIYIHKRIRRDNFFNKIKCSCYNDLNKDGQEGCPYCKGLGFLYDEKFIEAYAYNRRYESMIKSYNHVRPNQRAFIEDYIFLTRYSNNVFEGDFLIELKKNEYGEIISPFIKDSIFIVSAHKSIGIIKNLGEYTLLVTQTIGRHDYAK